MDTNKNLARHSGNAIEPVSQRPTITPAVDVYENDDELLLVADVPGASPDGIDVQLDKGQLTLQAG